jgi:hypothetical protein
LIYVYLSNNIGSPQQEIRMKALSIYLAGLVSLFVLSACTVPNKTTETQAKDAQKVTTEATAAAEPVAGSATQPAPAPAATSMRLVPCKVPGQKNCF